LLRGNHRQIIFNDSNDYLRFEAIVARAMKKSRRRRAVVPGLWLYEFGSTVARRFPTHGGAWLSALVKFGLEESPVSPRWLAQVLELAACYPVSLHDAAYHATALVHGGVFVSADERCTGTVLPHGAIVNLGDWMPLRGAGPKRRG
jgi:predicted nucleic acid-binding protein